MYSSEKNNVFFTIINDVIDKYHDRYIIGNVFQTGRTNRGSVLSDPLFLVGSRQSESELT